MKILDELKKEVWDAVMRYAKGQINWNDERSADLHAIADMKRTLEDPMHFKREITLLVADMVTPWWVKLVPFFELNVLKRELRKILRKPAYSDLSIMSRLLQEMRTQLYEQNKVLVTSQDAFAVSQLEKAFSTLTERYRQVVRENERFLEKMEEQAAYRSFRNLSEAIPPNEHNERLDRLEQHLAELGSANRELQGKCDRLFEQNQSLQDDRKEAVARAEAAEDEVEALQLKCDEYLKRIEFLETQLEQHDDETADAHGAPSYSR